MHSTTSNAITLDRPIDLERIKHVLHKISKNKTPGSDGIGWEFYKSNWSTIKNQLARHPERDVHKERRHCTIKPRDSNMPPEAKWSSESNGLPPHHIAECGLSNPTKDTSEPPTAAIGRTSTKEQILWSAG